MLKQVSGTDNVSFFYYYLRKICQNQSETQFLGYPVNSFLINNKYGNFWSAADNFRLNLRLVTSAPSGSTWSAVMDTDADADNGAQSFLTKVAVEFKLRCQVSPVVY